MMVWSITVALACIVAIIIYTSIRDGQRTSDFLEAITPEIDRFRDRQIEKYKEKFGRAPTGSLRTESPRPARRRRWFRRP